MCTLPHLHLSSDCMHRALVRNGVMVDTVLYNGTGDQIFVKTTILGAPWMLILQYQPIVFKLAQLASMGNLAPVGLYKGTKHILNFKADFVVEVLDDSHMDLSITELRGNSTIFQLHCPEELFQYDGASYEIVLPEVNDATNCISQALKKKHDMVHSIVYDPNRDAVTFKITKSHILIIPIYLSKVSKKRSDSAILE